MKYKLIIPFLISKYTKNMKLSDGNCYRQGFMEASHHVSRPKYKSGNFCGCGS
jgi:hypothetical protein